MLSDAARAELVAAFWLFVDGQEERLVRVFEASSTARRMVRDDPYYVLRLGSEEIDDRMARVICDAPLIVQFYDPTRTSERVAAAQDIARVLDARVAAKDAMAEIQRELAR